MRIPCGALAIVAMLSIDTYASPGPSSTEFAVAVTSASMVLVPARVNGRGPVYLVVDTAATSTVLDKEVAIAMGLNAGGVIEMITPSGSVPAPTGMLDELAVGPIRLQRLRVGWIPLREMRRIDARIAGVLGQDVLSGLTVSIDYRRRIARLGDGVCPRGDTSVPFEWVGGRPTVPARLFAPGLAGDARLVLDSAANATVVFSSRLTGTVQTKLGAHHGRTDAGSLERVQLDVGGIRLAVPVVIAPASSSRAETGLLPTSHFTQVCIDPSRQIATLTR